ncbi:glycosyltransferase [Psychroflexus planctonicus]|uniref:Glycosyl transferase n=1 Tax=Psychroflexus planctonicus TaxID=1526575 RepID=A0ABQ1SJK5_9FLAO|nr:glycosyltransferase [Psychroflexus planctonicus]GGE40065.1 glycosyl transferase [Psychroflexus planctonicus]
MKKLLILGMVWPEPSSSAAGSRMLQLIDVFLDWGFEISFACAAQKTSHSEALERQKVKEVAIQINHKSFDEFLKAFEPTHVLFDRFIMEEQLGWRVHQICPHTITILDTEDLHFLRKARHEAVKQNINFKPNLLFTESAKREIASILRCDVSLMISEAEMHILQRHFDVKPSQLFYLPFLLSESKIPNSASFNSFSSRSHFVSIGNFLHAPNWDQVLFLKEQIWPLIKQELPEAELHIYGAYAKQKVKQLNNEKQGFLVKGRAKNALEVIQNAKVLLAPLRFGAGLKGKLLDALLTGTPSVTTSIGVEGMPGDLPWAGEIANTPKEIAKQAILLYTLEKRWNKAQRNAVEILKKRFSKDSFTNLFEGKLHQIESDLTKHRQQHFYGQILHQNQLQSTKYMSLWIEEKNKPH